MKIIILILSFGLLTGCLESKNESAEAMTTNFKIEVNAKGYTPSEIKVPKNTDKVTLFFTRTTEKTCAREVVLEEQNINTELPLNEEVAITFALSGKTELVFGCHMDKMFSGRIVVK